MNNPTGRVFIIGAGMVGSTSAFAILLKGIAQEIVLIDINEKLLEAQILDLQQSVPFSSGAVIRKGDYLELEDDDTVIVTCGVSQKEGQTRLDLVSTNAKIIKEVASKIKESGKNIYLVMVTNPVDLLTYVAIKESGLEKSRVFGTGTMLDSARLRELISQKYKVNSEDVTAFILGEHGNSSFPAVSSMNINGINIKQMEGYSEALIEDFSKQVVVAADKIIEGKQATYYAIAATVSEIIGCIIRDENKIYPLSVLMKGEFGLSDVCLSVPCKLSANGVEQVSEFKLSDVELENLRKSAIIIKETIN